MAETIENLFIFIATYAPLLPILVYFIFFSKVREQALLLILLIYSFSEFLTNLSANYTAARVTVLLYALFTVVEYFLFAMILFYSIKRSTVKRTIIILSIIFVVFAIIYYFLVPIKILDSVPIGIEAVLILMYSFYYLYEEMQEDSQILIYNRYQFWIVGAILIYLAGSFFIYVFANQVDSKTRHIYWTFQNGFAIIKNILFVISILIFIKSNKNSSLRSKALSFK
jgi:hypothetical protein